MNERQIKRIEQLIEIINDGLMWDEKDQDEAYSILIAYKNKLNQEI